MTYSQTRPTSPALITFQQMADQLRLDDTTEQDYLADVVDACTEYAETALDASLLTRTITAHYYQHGSFNAGPLGWGHRNRLPLPRGPVQSITSVVDANGKTLTATLEGHGFNTYAVLSDQTWTAPVTVTYVAGYGPDATYVPSDIRLAIRTHAATLWERRASVNDKELSAVPHSLEDFYRLKKRSIPCA